MVGTFRTLPVTAKRILLLAAIGLLASILGNASVFAHKGEPSLGVFPYWDIVYHCHRVSPTTPPTWPGLQLGLVQVGDCITRVGDVELTGRNRMAITEEVGQQLQEDWYERHLAVSITRPTEDPPLVFQVMLPIMRLTWHDLLGVQLGLIIPGLILWMLGVIVLLARPQLEENQVLSAFLLLGGVSIMGAGEDWNNTYIEAVYGWLIVGGVRPFLGALLVHLAQIWPEPMPGRVHSRFRQSLYAVATVALVASFSENLGFIYQHRWVDVSSIINRSLDLVLFAVGIGMFFGRSLWMWRRSASPRASRQVRYFLVALLFSIPLVIMDMAIHQLGLVRQAAGISNITVVFLVLPGAGLLAYSMLRYQTFAYRGMALNVLLVVIVSTTLTALYALLLAPGGWDGIQFTTVWGAVLLATFFFFVDSPLRRGFRRLFVRHEYDYETAHRFSQHMASVNGVEPVLAIASETLCLELEVAWAAVSSVYRPHSLWLAQADRPDVLALPVGSDPPSSLWPGPPAHSQTIAEGTRQVGELWLGARTTAEPFDEKDAQLVGLLSQELARTLAVHAQIEDLERVPGRILAAVEADRRRIGQDLHDGVLQYLGAVPLDMDRASMLAETNLSKAQTILDRSAEQATTISEETRAIVYDLSPPQLAQAGLLAQARNYAEQMCRRHHIRLDWRAQGDGWNKLPEDRAIQVYRIIQQALSNAVQHAEPERISIDFTQEEGRLIVSIADDGVGFKPQIQAEGNHLGLFSMQERAKVLGGGLVVESAPGSGTVVRALIPTKEGADGRQQFGFPRVPPL